MPVTLRSLQSRCWILVSVAAWVVIGAGCRTILVPSVHPPSSLPVAESRVPMLKVHMRSGELFTLTSWRVDEEGRQLEGTGERYSVHRRLEGKGNYTIAVADVALFETNRPDKVGAGSTAVLAVMSTILGAVTLACVIDPKSCFGSCPTFYVEGGSQERPVAEGFSASIARALEARDVDALFETSPGRRLVLAMRNEALETHAVRAVHLLVADRPSGGRVLAGVDGRFYPASGIQDATACGADEGDCLPALVAIGGAERFSAADSKDLATRETVELEFPPARGRLGLAVAGRNTLLSTHLFYQTLAYLGSRAGSFLANVERGGPAVAERAMGMARLLGGIDAEVSEDGGPWRPIGSFDEAGPIAGDVKVIPFEAAGGPLRVRLRQAKGHWRLDYAAVARLGAPVTPRRLEPVSVESGGRPDPRALALLRRGDRHLITVPGDEYRIAFDLPEAPHGLELFLESEGYYYEWMRDEWLAEEDEEMATLVVADPAEALRRMAGSFKGREGDMERAFWASRFQR